MMATVWSREHLSRLLLAYAAAACVGPMLYASSQALLERFDPTSAPTHSAPLKQLRSSPSEIELRTISPTPPQRFETCKEKKDDHERLNCYDASNKPAEQDAPAFVGATVPTEGFVPYNPNDAITPLSRGRRAIDN